MRLTRRDFIKASAAGGAGLMVLGRAQRAWAFYQSSGIPLFGTTLRGVGPGGIPVAAPDSLAAPITGVTHYTININQFTDQICPVSSGLAPTTLWGYDPASPLGGGTQPQKHLGGIIVGTRGQPIQITFRNNLSATNGVTKHIIPNDLTIPGANQGFNRTATHLHGGLVPWISDGGPFDWWTPDGVRGASFLNNAALNPGAGANAAEYYYGLDQSARFLWYHDHAYGITRINAYAGIATALLIRDTAEINLKNQGLPEFIENSVLGGTTVVELPLVIQDKIFVGTNGVTADPTYEGMTTPGSLWYAHLYETSRFGKLGPVTAGVPGDPSIVPEFFGDTMLVNGTTYPEVQVEPRRYRFRILNACNARFLNLQLYVDDGSPNGITLDNGGNPLNVPARNVAAANPNGKPTSNFLVLGTEAGFLPTPAFVPCSVPFNPAALGGSLVLGPAERSDLLFDFSAHAGQNLILYTDTPAPFPGGDPRNDYFPGLNPSKNPVNALTTAGSGPNTRVLMRFKVGTGVTAPADIPLAITRATALGGTDALLVPLGVTTPPPGVKLVPLTLNEAFDDYGRLAQFLGTNLLQPYGGFGQPYGQPATETAADGDIQVWQIANLTADTHPIHFHLVNVQILSRQPFAASSYTGVPNVKGAPVPPPPEERGWKETVRMNPGEVTTVIMQFKLPKITGPLGTGPNKEVDFAAVDNGKGQIGGLGTPPPSPRTGGNEYVWHCHILEHEEHDMMRPLVVG
jgi:spore coat protein A, manganese oxidase